MGVACDGFEESTSKRRHGQVANNCKTKVPKVGVGIGCDDFENSTRKRRQDQFAKKQKTKVPQVGVGVESAAFLLGDPAPGGVITEGTSAHPFRKSAASAPKEPPRPARGQSRGC